MKSPIPVYKIDLPQYKIDTEPDHKAIGKIVDDVLKKYFLGKTVLVRGLGSQEHPEKSIDDLIEIIKETGSDRYDKKRSGDRYENIGNKHIDLFALRRKITLSTKLFWQLSWSFFNFPPKSRGPIRVNILVIYKAEKLKAVVHRYEGRTDTKRDGFIFKDSKNKQQAVLGIIRIN